MREVTLGGRRAAGRSALVDDADYELVRGYRWWACVSHRTMYACAWDGGHPRRVVWMHSLIAGDGIDHENGDGLDNRRANLRPATVAQQNANRGSFRGSSEFKGVSWAKRQRRWEAYITVDYRRRRLGYFTDEVAAARAYDGAALAAWGEFARLNFP